MTVTRWSVKVVVSQPPPGFALDPDLVHVIHGFDSLLVLSGSNPSLDL
jgi:hypothetical protein